MIRSLVKWFLHLVSGKCQIARICLEYDQGYQQLNGENKDEVDMVWKFAFSLYHSKKLKQEKFLVFEYNLPFNVNQMMKNIYQIKKLEYHNYGSNLDANITLCLERLNSVNVLMAHINGLIKLQYDVNNLHHIHLLDDLWHEE